MAWANINPLQRLTVNGSQGIKPTRLQELLLTVVDMVYKHFVPSVVHGYLRTLHLSLLAQPTAAAHCTLLGVQTYSLRAEQTDGHYLDYLLFPHSEGLCPRLCQDKLWQVFAVARAERQFHWEFSQLTSQVRVGLGFSFTVCSALCSDSKHVHLSPSTSFYVELGI